MTRLAKKQQQKKRQFPIVDLSQRAKIVIEPQIRTDATSIVRTSKIRKYNYDYITDGVNPTREERRKALLRGIAARLQLEKR